MSDNEQLVLDRLARLGIAFVRHEHPAVATVGEAEMYWAGIDAAHCKNLFLRNQRGDRHYLVIVAHTKRVDLRGLAAQIGDGKLSFASPERLRTHLGVEPGAVSPCGLVHDTARGVAVVVDRELRFAGRITCHPNVNTATIVVSFADLERFVAECGHTIRFIDVPA